LTNPTTQEQPLPEALETLATVLPRVKGEPDNAYQAFLFWSAQPHDARRWRTVCLWLGRTPGYTTQLKRWAEAWSWAERAPMPDPQEDGGAALQAKVDKVDEKVKRTLAKAEKVASAALTGARQVDREVTTRMARLERYEAELRRLWEAELRIGSALLSKLIPAVQALDGEALAKRPRDLAALLTSTRGMVDSAAANLSEAEGVRDFLDQARRELEETPPAPPEPDNDSAA